MKYIYGKGKQSSYEIPVGSIMLDFSEMKSNTFWGKKLKCIADYIAKTDKVTDGEVDILGIRYATCKHKKSGEKRTIKF